MRIGIPRETKTGECRIALIPDHARLLIQAGHEVVVEKDAGKKCGFPDKEYKKEGAAIADDVYGCDMVVRVKEPPLSTIKRDQIIMGYLHVEKGQNPRLLKRFLDKHATSYAYEEIRDERGMRLVNLGVEAGIIGMYEGLRLYGRVLEEKGIRNVFRSLKPIKEHNSIENVYKAIRKAGLDKDTSIYILGKGKVSSGAQALLEHTRIKPDVLYRDRTIFIERYLPKADIIFNAVDWYPGEPHIITKDMLGLMRETSVIIDISCDKNGAVESCIPTTWQKPTYVFNGITHSCIDNLPSALPGDSSIHLSSMIIGHVLKVADGEWPRSGLMTMKGSFMYKSGETGQNRHMAGFKKGAAIHE